MANRPGGTLYIGVTSNPVQRVWQHKNNIVPGFTQNYGIHTLVWYETHATMESAIQREKSLKNWHRPWKIRLIEKSNPNWKDLFSELTY